MSHGVIGNTSAFGADIQGSSPCEITNIKLNKMSTRNNTLIIPREVAENYEAGFAIDPSVIRDNSFVNMYLHHDGYLQGVGLDLAEWIITKQADGFTARDGSRIAALLVHEFHYPSQFLYPNNTLLDTEFTYVIWTGKADFWISCYNNVENKCVFVGTPDSMITKHGLKPSFQEV